MTHFHRKIAKLKESNIVFVMFEVKNSISHFHKNIVKLKETNIVFVMFEAKNSICHGAINSVKRTHDYLTSFNGSLDTHATRILSQLS